MVEGEEGAVDEDGAGGGDAAAGQHAQDLLVFYLETGLWALVVLASAAAVEPETQKGEEDGLVVDLLLV